MNITPLFADNNWESGVSFYVRKSKQSAESAESAEQTE